MSLGNNIRNIRKSKGLSIMNLRELTGLSKSTISDLENDKSSPTADTLQKIADALNVSVEYFFKGEENYTVSTQELTPKDEKDIAKDVKSIMTKIASKEAGPTYYEGNELSEDDLDLFQDALEFALKRIKVKNKEKYTPKKYKK